MFVRPANQDEAARRRAEGVEQRIQALLSTFCEEPCERDARARLELASIYNWQGKYRQTQQLLEPLAREPFPLPIVMAARQMIGDSHFRHDQYDLANKQFHENLEMAKKTESEYWTARAKDGIAWVLIEVGHFASGEFVSAGQVFEETLPVYERMGNRIAEAMGLHGMSRAVAGTGDYDLAIDYAHRAIAMLEANGGEDFVQLPLFQLAMVYRDYGAFDRSQPYFEQAIDRADRSQDPYTQVSAALGYGCLLQFLREPDRAREMWLACQPIIEACDFPRLGHETNVKLAADAVEREDFKEAYKRQMACQDYGNRIGVISPVLQNQQMLLRTQIHKTAHLEDTLTYMTAAVEASSDAFFVLGAPMADIAEGDFVIHYLNATAARLLGKKPVDVTHVLVREAWKLPTSELLIDASMECFADGLPRSLDPVQLQFPGAGEKWYSVKIVRIPTGVGWTVRDVTERQRMQQQIVSQRDRLEEANTRLLALDREKTEMLGMAAHDLRTPIANIYSITELIKSSDPATLKWLGLIRSSAESLLSLLGNLLDLNRIERGELELHVAPVDVCGSLAKTVDGFSARAQQKGIQLRLICPADQIVALADEGSLAQVVENLLSNALKFSPRGATVEVRATRTGDRVRIEIQDQGPGISEEDQKRLFGKFVRLSARPTGGETSTGLGLSIVKKLVEAMGGTAGCQSQLGTGATFWLELREASAE